MDQHLNDFLFCREEEGSVANPSLTEDDEGFSEPRTPMSEPPSEFPNSRPATLLIRHDSTNKKNGVSTKKDFLKTLA